MGSSRGRGRSGEVAAAKRDFDRRMAAYEKHQFKPLDMSQYELDLSKYEQENVFEDLPGLEAYRESADYAAEQFRQSQANIMAQYRGAAGASGIAGVAQALSGQAAQFGRQQQVTLGERAAEQRRLAVQEEARLKGQERQLMLAQDVGRRDLLMGEQKIEREFDLAKLSTLLGVSAEQLSGARQAQAARDQARANEMGALLGFAGAVITASDRRLKKNIRKEGKSKSGLQIYSFEWKDIKDGGEGRWQGVLADDLPKLIKDKAVYKSTDGYDMVDYSKIDINYKKIS